MKLSPNQILVLGAIRSQGPMTAWEVAELTGTAPTTVKPRINELVRAGILEAAGAKLNPATGRANVAYGLAANSNRKEYAV